MDYELGIILPAGTNLKNSILTKSQGKINVAICIHRAG